MGSVSLSKVKRPVRTRMQGVVGGSGERPRPARLAFHSPIKLHQETAYICQCFLGDAVYSRHPQSARTKSYRRLLLVPLRSTDVLALARLVQSGQGISVTYRVRSLKCSQASMRQPLRNRGRYDARPDMLPDAGRAECLVIHRHPRAVPVGSG